MLEQKRDVHVQVGSWNPKSWSLEDSHAKEVHIQAFPDYKMSLSGQYEMWGGDGTVKVFDLQFEKAEVYTSELQ